MTLSFEDLFAIRIAYQDMYNDESNIIRELKKELIRDNMNSQEIDDYLVNFYKNYGIEISKETISAIQIPINRGPRIRLSDLSGNSILNFLLNPNNFNNSVNLVNETLNSQLNQQENNDSDDSNDSNDSDDSNDSNDSDDSDDSDDIPELESDDVPELESDYDDMPELEEVESNNTNVETLTFSMGINHGNQNPFIHYQNNVNHNILPNTFNTINNTSANNFLQNFLNILNIQNPQNMEDVRATLGKEGEKEIKHYNLKEDKEGTCSVCMMSFEKDQEVSELKCGHIFHKECIMKWLKEYNYKCPVCRAECGKPKFNLNDNET